MRRKLAPLLSIFFLFSIPFVGQHFFVPYLFVSLCLAFGTRRKVFRLLLKWPFILALAFFSLPLPLLMGGGRENFFEGFRMAGRMALFLLWLRVLLDSIRLRELMAFFERAGARNLGVKVTVALNLLPLFAESARTTWEALKLKKEKKTPLLFFHFARIFLINSVRTAENLAKAAYLRGIGYDDLGPDRSNRSR